MSQRVKERLKVLQIADTSHEERIALDQAIEEATGQSCENNFSTLTDDQFIALLNKVRAQIIGKKKRNADVAAVEDVAEQTVAVTA